MLTCLYSFGETFGLCKQSRIDILPKAVSGWFTARQKLGKEAEGEKNVCPLSSPEGKCCCVERFTATNMVVYVLSFSYGQGKI